VAEAAKPAKKQPRLVVKVESSDESEHGGNQHDSDDSNTQFFEQFLLGSQLQPNPTQSSTKSKKKAKVETNGIKVESKAESLDFKGQEEEQPNLVKKTNALLESKPEWTTVWYNV